LTAQDQSIIDLWQGNVSAQGIADKFGVTKNTIVGKITRLRNRGYDLRKRRPPKQVVAVAQRTSKPKLTIPWISSALNNLINEPKTAHVNKPKGIMELGIDDCRYIISGDTASSYLFCGNEKASKTYCIEHHRLCYAPLPKKPKDGVFKLKKLTYTAPHRNNVKFQR
jgi:hypothetical protein